MKNLKTSLLVLGVTLGLVGCSINRPEPWDYSAFLESNPKSILVVMPTSVSNDIKAAPACLASSVLPLSEAGYYPLPVTVVNDTFKYNGVTVAGEIQNISLKKLREIFNADAVMYINVDDYRTSYQVTDSVTRVTVSAKLVDTRTEKLLWQNKFTTTNASGGSGNVFANMIAAAIKHVINETTDQGYIVARRNAAFLYSPGGLRTTPILAGPYSPIYRKDYILQKIEEDKKALSAK